MITKNQIKLINSLQQKKYRKEHQLFIAEGMKVIQEFLNASFKLNHLYFCTDHFQNVSKHQKTQLSKSELEKITALHASNDCIAIFHIPNEKVDFPSKELSLVLDAVRDPGNLGTIIRLADWFGIEKIYCSLETVDCFNPKVVQASMGSLARVSLQYVSLPEFFVLQKNSTIYGTFMDATSVYETPLREDGFLVLGNEANGISDAVLPFISEKISIPRFGSIQKTESLNVATAAAILLSEFKRRNVNET